MTVPNLPHHHHPTVGLLRAQRLLQRAMRSIPLAHDKEDPVQVSCRGLTPVASLHYSATFRFSYQDFYLIMSGLDDPVLLSMVVFAVACSCCVQSLQLASTCHCRFHIAACLQLAQLGSNAFTSFCLGACHPAFYHPFGRWCMRMSTLLQSASPQVFTQHPLTAGAAAAWWVGQSFLWGSAARH